MLAVVGHLRGAFDLRSRCFPATNFPRIIIGVDNGVMPIDQMEVTITRPIEEAVNSVPGLEDVRSITSRGSAEIDLFFNWNVDMVQTLQLVNSAIVAHPEHAARRRRRSRRIASISRASRSSATASRPTRFRKRSSGRLATYDIKPRSEPAERRRQRADSGRTASRNFRSRPIPRRMLRSQV